MGRLADAWTLLKDEEDDDPFRDLLPGAPDLEVNFEPPELPGGFRPGSLAAAWEEIEVPAGKFRALRMESCWTNTTSGWYGCGMKHWYAPEAKTFIKRQTPSDWDKGLQKMDFELDSFAPAK